MAAVEDKIEQLKDFKNGSLSAKELADSITERRLNWMIGHIDVIYQYNGLPPEEKAHKIIFLEHMDINPEHSEVIRIADNAIRINSYNFCPYPAACNELNLDTRIVCKEIGEPSIREMCKIIHPKLEFIRYYEDIRPHNPHFCREYIFINSYKSR